MAHSTPLIPASLIDCVFTPGLAFDEKGTRLGFGGGVYDRLLSQTKQATKVGLFFEKQGVFRLPKDRFDVSLDKVITERKQFDFSRGGAARAS